MRDYTLESNMRREVDSVLESTGFSLVELTVQRSRNNVHVNVTVHKRPAVDLESLTQVSRTLKKQLENLEESEDMNLVVTSPGIDRRIKSRREYDIFQGKGIRLLLENESEWRCGVIRKTEGEVLHLATPSCIQEIDLGSVRKAKLDYTQEVESREDVL